MCARSTRVEEQLRACCGTEMLLFAYGGPTRSRFLRLSNTRIVVLKDTRMQVLSDTRKVVLRRYAFAGTQRSAFAGHIVLSHTRMRRYQAALFVLHQSPI
eukprot:2636576-Rhodomonas_salina.1